jgi:hypothetical protein
MGLFVNSGDGIGSISMGHQANNNLRTDLLLCVGWALQPFFVSVGPYSHGCVLIEAMKGVRTGQKQEPSDV